MPKKDKKKAADTKKEKGREPADVVEAVRGAVERTFQVTAGQTEGARDRGRTLLDDVASAAQRIRESFDDLRVLEDVRGLRAEIEALNKRVAELEKKQAAAPTAAAKAKATPAKPAAGRAATTRRTPAKSASTTAKKAPAKPSAAATAAKTTGPQAKPSTPRRKPAAPSGGS